jgi:hypothetical protein
MYMRRKVCPAMKDRRRLCRVDVRGREDKPASVRKEASPSIMGWICRFIHALGAIMTARSQ